MDWMSSKNACADILHQDDAVWKSAACEEIWNPHILDKKSYIQRKKTERVEESAFIINEMKT